MSARCRQDPRGARRPGRRPGPPSTASLAVARPRSSRPHAAAADCGAPRPPGPRPAVDAASTPDRGAAGGGRANRLSVRPADGGLGRRARRAPVRPGPPPLAALRRRRGGHRVGRGHRRAARRAGQPPPAGPERHHRRRPRRPAPRPDGRPRRGGWRPPRPRRRPPAHPLRPLEPARRRAPAPGRLPPPAARSPGGRRARARGRCGRAVRRRARRPGRRLRAGRGARPERPGSTSSTSSTATATCCTSCCPRSTDRAATAATSAGRTRFLRRVAEGVRAEAPGLGLAVRLSAFDLVPHAGGDGGRGVPDARRAGAYRYAFGGDGTGLGVDLAEVHELLRRARRLGRRPGVGHRGQPLLLPPRPAARVVPALRRLPPAPRPPGRGRPAGAGHRRRWPAPIPASPSSPPASAISSSGCPHAAQALVRAGGAAAVGYGRMALSYPDLPRDVLAGRPSTRAQICRTLSDCTTAPRQGLVSGCYPYDPFYKAPARARRAGGGQAPGGDHRPGAVVTRPAVALSMYPGARALRPAARAPRRAGRGRRRARPRRRAGPARRPGGRGAGARPTCCSATGAARWWTTRCWRGRRGCAMLAYAAGTVRDTVTAGGVRPRPARHVGRGRQRGAGRRVHGGGDPVGQQGRRSSSGSGCGAPRCPRSPAVIRSATGASASAWSAPRTWAGR